MQRIVRRLSTLVSIVIVAGFMLFAHSFAISVNSHETNGMNHTTGSSPINCASLCTYNAFYKDEPALIVREDEDEDDKPVLPYYIALRSTFISNFESASELYPAAIKPLPKVPIYIHNQVFRI